jgi:hypothetical protein
MMGECLHPKNVELFAKNKILYKSVILLEHFKKDIENLDRKKYVAVHGLFVLEEAMDLS